MLFLGAEKDSDNMAAKRYFANQSLPSVATRHPSARLAHERRYFAFHSLPSTTATFASSTTVPLRQSLNISIT